jgi:hypothetical protein
MTFRALLLAVVAVVAGAVHCHAAVAASPDRLTLRPITLAAAPVAGPSLHGAPAAAPVAGPSLHGAPAAAPDRYSGYFRLNHTADAHMFFFLFEARAAPDAAPVVLWMTGGPGCSSELAVFYENGPWTIGPDLQLRDTEFGWDRSAHMVFVDQPIGTGFSYSADDDDRCYDEACVAADMLDFMQALFAARPHLAGRDVYVTGESYAGHYVPAVASAIFRAAAAGDADIRLAGLAIGNGLTDPAVQYGAYADFALQEGLISEAVRDGAALFYPACKLALEVCDGADWAVECELAVEFCQATQFGPVMAANPGEARRRDGVAAPPDLFFHFLRACVGCLPRGHPRIPPTACPPPLPLPAPPPSLGINVYDYRKQCIAPLCYDFSLMDRYLAQPAVRKALGVGGRTWEACSESVHADMMGARAAVASRTASASSAFRRCFFYSVPAMIPSCRRCRRRRRCLGRLCTPARSRAARRPPPACVLRLVQPTGDTHLTACSRRCWARACA